ncbi:MAG TPA: J domain-containing protein [Polyangia bacterium]|nr:J domain-containing protein [Polyangia bacterium]
MTISKRLFDMARAELNSLLDKASTWESPRDPDEDLYRRYGLDQLTDEQLEAELERRHRARAAAQAKANAPRPSPASSGSRPRSARPSSGPLPRRSSPEDDLRRAYAALEVPVGSNFETVRKSYRALMRKYHPDHHSESPEKQKTATELTQKLTEAYKLLERRLRR